jgi:4'-phosphopantetheinyl transferase
VFLLYNILQTGNIDAAQQDAWLQELPEIKQGQISRLLHRSDQLRSLAGYQLLKTGMTLLKQRDFHLSQLDFTANGRPAHTCPVNFSLSHSGSLVTCALNPSGKIGIDTEQHRELPRSLGRYLSAQESQTVNQTPLAFFDIWTRKEAVVKAASNKGLADLPLVFLLETDRAEFKNQIWFTRAVPILDDYSIHIATDLPDGDVRLMMIPLA